MKSRLLSSTPQRNYVVVLEKGDEAVKQLLAFARQEQLSSASVQGIGAFSAATLGFFDRNQSDYLKIAVAEQVEVLTLMGNVTLSEGKPKLHLHAVLGKRDGSAHGGHLLRGEVWPTLEVMIVEHPPQLRRKSDPETGLALLDPGLGS
jgi:uncharacterized protein